MLLNPKEKNSSMNNVKIGMIEPAQLKKIVTISENT